MKFLAPIEKKFLLKTVPSLYSPLNAENKKTVDVVKGWLNVRVTQKVTGFVIQQASV